MPTATKSQERAAKPATERPSLDKNAHLHSTAPSVQSSAGNLAVQRLFHAGTIQTKLSISRPDDPYEQEADRVAEQVMRMPEPAAPGKNVPVRRQTGGALQKKDDVAKTGAGQPQAGPDLQKKLQNSKDSGNPLPKDMQSSYGAALGADISNVKIHTGTDAAEMNRDLGAHAFTHGSNIYFNSGKYDPTSSSGKHLLAHELTHTVQQGASAPTAKQQAGGIEGRNVKPNAPDIQAAWYNFDIPFTDYQFDPSIRGIKNAANIAKDAVVAGFDWIVDEIKGLLDSGKKWLLEQWSSIQEIAQSGFEAVQHSFTEIVKFIQSPLSFIAAAIMSFNAQSVAAAWAAFSGIVTGIWKGFKLLTDNLLQQVSKIWEGISGFAASLFSRVDSLTRNFLFRKLPNALQNVAYSLINTVKSLWKRIDDGWKKIFNKIKTWIGKALDTVFQFILRVGSFTINVIIEGIRQFGELVFFLQDLFTNPRKYIAILADKSVAAFEGVEGRFSGIVQQYFGEDKQPATAAAVTGTIQRKPDAPAAEVKTSATWGEMGGGIWEIMGKKWNEFKSNPLSIVTGLLLDLFFPIYGNIKDVIQLFTDIKNIVTGPLSAGSLEELWTSILQILEIPILIYKTVVGILMRSLMVPLIVASFIPHPLVKAIAAAVGLGLLGAFVEAEVLTIGQKVLLLKTGVTTKNQKEEAYNRVADSFIALAMTAVIMIVVLILHFIANIMKGIYSFVKGKVFPVEKAPVEVKSGLPGEGKEPAKIEQPKDVPEKTPPETKPEGKPEVADNGKDITDQVRSGERSKPKSEDWTHTRNWDKWVEEGGTIKEHPDGSITLTAKDGTSVKYSPNGDPNFKPHLNDPWGIKEVQIDKFTERPADFRNANKAAGHPEWGDRSPADYTWHHTHDGRTLQLVPRRIHRLFRHSGGISDLKK